ncbi:NAD(P)H-dependent oxidoreductase [Bacillus sp. EB106-08-02-XG196]|uniref:NADPH-dependent FMN reductase n=1 Tax=Bacillus sp. EB106-08-02-XG196 TaxID=2737049 RepID=UPI0015C474F4|nr:NAD(P)H-dependent oxidoreductase [Bacillus sp. EB106-08-02-XG196]
MKILGISGTLIGSKTIIITKYLMNEIKRQYPEFELEMINLKDFQLDFCDGRPQTEYNNDTQEIIKKFENADGYVLGTTIIHNSIPGALKNLFDLIPVSIFENKTIALVANGGNPQHSQAIENHLIPITNYLKMKTLPNQVFAVSSDFNCQNELNNPEIQDQFIRLVKNYGEIVKQNTQEMKS